MKPRYLLLIAFAFLVLGDCTYLLLPVFRNRIEAAWMVHPKIDFATLPDGERPTCASEPNDKYPSANTENRDNAFPSKVGKADQVEQDYSLMPGDLQSIHNRRYSTIVVHSGYPVRIRMGKCLSDFATDVHCSGTPEDVLIMDMRRWPILGSPATNLVHVMASAH